MSITGEQIGYPVNIEEEQVKKDFPHLTKIDWFRISNYLKQTYENGYKDGWWTEQDTEWQRVWNELEDRKYNATNRLINNLKKIFGENK